MIAKEGNYIINDKRRCRYCNGREVIQILGGASYKINLAKDDLGFYCKDKNECKENREAELSQVTFSFNDEGNVSKVKVEAEGKFIELEDCLNGA